VRLGRHLRVENCLGDPFPIAQVNENQLPVVTPSVDPASDSHRLSDMFLAQFPAVMRSQSSFRFSHATDYI
jgi:hypothetical protein